MVAKGYNNRQMRVEGPEEEYFFPKAVPPVCIKARSREEAEAKLLGANNKAK